MTHSSIKTVAVLYHAQCPDGFGAAWAAWKKYGETAEYIPVKHGMPSPEGLAGREVYIVDFSYSAVVLAALEREAAKLVVIDHHQTAREAVEALAYHSFDLGHSGAVLAWQYFYPDVPVPLLLQYIEDGDLWRFALPSSEALLAYLYTHDFSFEAFDRLACDLEDEKVRAEYIAKGEVIREYREGMVRQVAEGAIEVMLEGYRVLAVNASSLIKSELGHVLAMRQGPFGIVWYADGMRIKCSLRGDGSVDVAAIAQKYGGGGHHDAASFICSERVSLPFVPV